MNVDLNTIITSIIAPLVGALVWFLRRAIERLDASAQTMASMNTSLKLLEQNFEHVQRDVASALVLAQRLTESEARIAVMERNLVTAFSKIDACNERLDGFKKRAIP